MRRNKRDYKRSRVSGVNSDGELVNSDHEPVDVNGSVLHKARLEPSNFYGERERAERERKRRGEADADAVQYVRGRQRLWPEYGEEQVERFVHSVPTLTEDCALLGCSDKLVKADINASFRRMARTLHPDKGGSNDAFVRLTNARDRLLSLARLYAECALLFCAGMFVTSDFALFFVNCVVGCCCRQEMTKRCRRHHKTHCLAIKCHVAEMCRNMRVLLCISHASAKRAVAEIYGVPVKSVHRWTQFYAPDSGALDNYAYDVILKKV